MRRRYFNNRSMNNNIIIYTSLDNLIVTPNTYNFGDNAIITNVINNNIGKITFVKDLTTIGTAAFGQCTLLTSVIIPNSVTQIGSSAFYKCTSLTSITIPDSVTSIGDDAFSGCTSLTSITIPDSVTSIGDDAFYGCTSLESVVIPKGVKEIGARAFNRCTSLESIVVADGNPVYDSREGCNAIIETATNTLIKGCKTTVIPKSVTEIGQSAFSGCNSLTSITIPESVTKIEEYAFSGCSSLTSVYCKATTPPALDGTWVFNSNGSGRKIYVPKESVDAYQSAGGWREYGNAIVGYNF